jgi:hypothetical protein
MLIIHNAKVYTQIPDNKICTALLIDNGRIMATGTDDEILNLSPRSILFDRCPFYEKMEILPELQGHLIKKEMVL